MTKPPVVESRPLIARLKPPMSSVPGARTRSEPFAVLAPTFVPVLVPTIVTACLPDPLGRTLSAPIWRVPALIVVRPE